MVFTHWLSNNGIDTNRDGTPVQAPAFFNKYRSPL